MGPQTFLLGFTRVCNFNLYRFSAPYCFTPKVTQIIGRSMQKVRKSKVFIEFSLIDYKQYSGFRGEMVAFPPYLFFFGNFQLSFNEKMARFF